MKSTAEVRGIDFTSTPTRTKPITCARCTFDGERLRVERVDRSTSLESFETLLSEPGAWIAGIDFPFGQPRKLLETLCAQQGWPLSWPGYVDAISKLSRDGFGEILAKYKEHRKPGDREHLRAVDKLTRSQSPSKWFGVPVGKMFFEGAQRLLRSPVSVLPMRQTDAPRLVVEAYPALVARILVESEKYKPEAEAAQAAARSTRQKMVTGLAGGPLKKRYGFIVEMPAEVRSACIDDESGDYIDAVLAAVQAAWALTQKDDGYGIPQNADPLEGWIVDPSTRPSRNSSHTRVRPAFQQLLKRDPSGASWLPRLLDLVAVNPVAQRMVANPGRLNPAICVRRRYADRLQGDVEIEQCFEFSVPPRPDFLAWLLDNPDALEWPMSGGQPKVFGTKTQGQRQALIQKDDADRRKQAQEDGHKELRRGASEPEKKWWAFEGATEVDCFLETDTLVLVIEGKRTESLSESTMWYHGRNQLHRNLEAARERATGREYGVLVISEEPLEEKALGDPARGFPHMTHEDRSELMAHYLGNVTWAQVCTATGIAFDSLPRNIAPRAVRKNRKSRTP